MKRVGLRILAAVMSVFMAFSLLPGMGIGGCAKADDGDGEWVKTVECLGTSIIKAPAAPADGSTPWTGSYVWYGKYDGNPVKYRVLAPKTTTYGGITMLLDCDTILYKAKFDEDGELNQYAQKLNEWQYSDLKAGLNGNAFLTKENGFATLEEAAIVSSKVNEHKLNTGNPSDDIYVNYVGLTGEKVFLLDYEDVMNPQYGYTFDSGMERYEDGDGFSYDWHATENRIKENSDGNVDVWELRSAGNHQDNIVGYVYNDGEVCYLNDVNVDNGVSPAFNVNLSSVLFSSVIKGIGGKDHAEYKLTLINSDLKIGIQSGKEMTVSNRTVTVPYTITGADASSATQISVLILDKPFAPGDSNDSTIKYYGKLNTGSDELMPTGTGTFTLPSGLNVNEWGSSYCIYMLAEDVNGIHETDFASNPIGLATPNRFIAGIGASAIKAPTAPENVDMPWIGSYVWYGKYDGNPVRYRVLAPKTTAYGGTTMLLDCDTILYKAKFDENGKPNLYAEKPNEWQYSDIKEGMNGSSFLTKPNGFSEVEKAAITSSRVDGHNRDKVSPFDSWWVEKDYVGLNDEKVFLLDFEEVMNPQYGYTSDSGVENITCTLFHDIKSRIKEDASGSATWWLRNDTLSYLDSTCFMDGAGCVYDGGYLNPYGIEHESGVSPAFNVNLSSVIFTSVVSGVAGKENAEYKLALKDNDLHVEVPFDKFLETSGSEITVPYTITGADASNATQLSVLILDKPYTDGNSNDAVVKYYGKLNTGDEELSTAGTGTFTLPSEFNVSGWNNSYFVYMLAEDINGAYETDNVSALYALSLPVKTIAGLGTSAIEGPAEPTDKDSPWTGSYVWYGLYEGTPVRYRVLAPETTAYGGTTMLLDCDTVLYEETWFDEDEHPNTGAQTCNEWRYSDVKTGLNGSAFLTKENGITALERAAIAYSNVSGHKLNLGSFTDEWFGNYTGLTEELVFLLDYEDVMNPEYGYTSHPGSKPDINYYPALITRRLGSRNRIKYDSNGENTLWWLRSSSVAHESDECVGYIDKGVVDFTTTWHSFGVSPAFNVNLSSVIFSSSVIARVVGRNDKEYKLTLADRDMTVGIQSGKNLTVSESKVTVPYAITGANATNATRMSVLILDKPYVAGNSNDATVLYYDKLNTDTAEELVTTGNGTFTLPEGLSVSGWDSSYFVYLLAEDVNGTYLTDYASIPLRLSAPYLFISAQPENTSVEVGDTAKFTVPVVGNGTLSFQWQYRKNSTSAWANSTQSGNKTATLSVATTAGLHGYQFRCVVSSNGMQEASEAATLTVKPKVTTQPADKSVTVGSTATFTVAATGRGTLKYQWQYRKNASYAWASSAQSGNKTATLSVATTAALHGYQFRCVVTDGNGQKSYSNAATLTVKPKITTQPADKSVTVGSTATFTVAATGRGTLQYQWQYRKNSSYAWASSAQSGNKTDTLLVATTAALHGYQFRCIVTDSTGGKAYSNLATLTLKPRITTQPVDKSLLVGSTAKFTVVATGKGTLTYQWQYRKNASCEWANSGQQGAKTDTLLVSTTAALHGYQFCCVVTDGNGQKSYTRAATLTLKPRITTQPADKSLLVGSTAKFTVAVTGKSTLKYQWQYRKNSSSEWADSGQSGNKTNTLLVSTTAGLHGYQFRCVVTDGNGQKSYSKTVTLTLKPRITTQPTDKSVTAGNKAKFTVAATGKATLTYQWQYRKNSSSAWADSGQSGNKTATLSVATTKALNGYQFRCVVTDGNGRKTYSSIVTLTVK